MRKKSSSDAGTAAKEGRIGPKLRTERRTTPRNLLFDGSDYLKDMIRRIKKIKLVDGYRILDVMYIGARSCSDPEGNKFIVEWQRDGDEFAEADNVSWHVGGSIHATDWVNGLWIVHLKFPARFAKLIADPRLF